MKKIIHLTLFLAIVSAIAGAALAFANQMTAPIIAANEEATEKASLLELYPGSTVDDFTEVSYEGDSSTIQKIYRYKEEGIRLQHVRQRLQRGNDLPGIHYKRWNGRCL